jgi:hypothetical protein
MSFLRCWLSSDFLRDPCLGCARCPSEGAGWPSRPRWCRCLVAIAGDSSILPPPCYFFQTRNAAVNIFLRNESRCLVIKKMTAVITPCSGPTLSAVSSLFHLFSCDSAPSSLDLHGKREEPVLNEESAATVVHAN